MIVEAEYREVNMDLKMLTQGARVSCVNFLVALAVFFLRLGF